MNAKLKIDARIGIASIILLLAGCGTSEQLKSGSEAQATTSAKTEPKPETSAKPKEVEEPVVEVIPGKAKPSELTVQPITEPPVEQATEAGTSEPKSDVVEPQTMPSGGNATQMPSAPGQLSGKKPGQPPPAAKGPNDFVITAEKKDSTHPYFGKGFPMGFVVNNVQGGDIVMERGKTYHLIVATDPMHDVYISTKDIGWGSTPYSDGVEGMYTYNGTITIKPTKSTPDTLYYSCRNHPYMGGTIHIVDPGQSVKVTKKAAKPNKQPAAKATSYSAGDADQKIMFADMLFKSKNSQTVLKSQIPEAIVMHRKAETELQNAKDKRKSGDMNGAYKSADMAVELLQKSVKLVPNQSELSRLKDQNKEILQSIEHFEVSHKESYERIAKERGANAAVDYDKKQVDALKQSANQLANKGDYRHANQQLEKAQRLITEALHKMLDKQTIIYDLNFKSAEEEYNYELKRFKGYEELIPIAVEQKKPAEGAKKLMETYVKKGQKLHDMAVEKAKQGDFPTAIAMLLDATKEVRRGLTMIGVSQ